MIASETSDESFVIFHQAFNGIVRVCLKELLPAIYRFLRLKPTTNSKMKPETSPNWKYLDQVMKKYLINFTRVRRSFHRSKKDFIGIISLVNLDDQCTDYTEYSPSSCPSIDSICHCYSNNTTSISQSK